MKRILLSLSVVALLSTAGGVFAEGTDTTNTTTPMTTSTNNNSAPNSTDPTTNNYGAPSTSAPDTNNTAPNGSSTPAQVKLEGLSATEAPLSVTVNGMPTSVSATAPGQINVPMGTDVKKLVVILNAPNGKTIKCTKVRVLKSTQASVTAPNGQILLRVSKDRTGNFHCENVEVQGLSSGSSM